MEQIRLELSVNEVNAILGGLAKLPFEAVHQIIGNIQQQAQSQVQAPQNPNLGNATATKEPS